ncbi:MAG: restriction system protein [Vicingaceae bacterium]|jgi:restriction system protein
MAIPKHDDICIEVMTMLQSQESIPLKDFIEPLKVHFKLTDEEASKMYESGNGVIFYDRVSWALSYLHMAGLLDKPKRGVYKISIKGLEFVKTPDKINSYVKKQVEKRGSTKQPKKEKLSDRLLFEETDSESTPQEKLNNSFNNIKKSIYSEILSTILSKNPFEFERIVVQLLQKMGYGGEIKDSGIVTKKSNDGGIDGVIKEDILGLGRINIQAKRYKLDNGISREEIQKFVGALAVAQSNKGVFITTSYYSKGALQYAESLNGATTLVLIDGKQFAEYMYEFGLGMQVEQVVEIKKLDADFWDQLKNEN